MRHHAVIASSNPGKLIEIKRLLNPLGFDLSNQDELGLDPPPETGLTFIENALAKARAASRATGLPALADDSGLEVDALGGAPGVHSARFAGSQGNDQANIAKLLAELESRKTPDRRARFRCLIVYLPHAAHPAPLIADGTWEGLIGMQPCGTQGFGYDPIFYLPRHGCTAAELSAADKDRLSHRGQALRKLCALLRATTDPGRHATADTCRGISR